MSESRKARVAALTSQHCHLVRGLCKASDSSDAGMLTGQNYRISMPNDDVREFAETGQLNPLLGADQVS